MTMAPARTRRRAGAVKALRAALLVATLPAAAGMVRLYASLSSDMEELLPPDAPAVRALAVLRQRLPGSQYIGVVVRSGETGAGAGGAGGHGEAARFAAALAERIRGYPPDLVRLVRIDVGAERRFIREHAALYLDLAELRDVRSRIAARLARANPFYVSLEDGDDHEQGKAAGAGAERAPDGGGDGGPAAGTRALSAALAGIEARHAGADPFAGRFPDDRLVSADGRTALVLVFLATSDTGLARIGPLFERLRADVAALRPGERRLEVGYAGDAAISVEELAALEEDLAVSGALVLGLVALAVILYFRWWAAPLALGIPVLVGTAWGFGLASLLVPRLGASTAFLGSIIVGNGINPGIMLLARYLEERRAGADSAAACARAVAGTWRGTLAAALAASAGYAALTAGSFRGFSQFGIIGGIGTTTCWAATYLLLPALLRRVDRRARWRGGGARDARRERAPGVLARLVERRPAAVLAVTAALVAAAGILAAVRLDRSFIEYDMTKLRRRGSAIHGEGRWSREMDGVLGRNFTAVAVMAEHEADLPVLVARLRAATRRQPLAPVASGIVAPGDLLPADQPAKRAELLAIRRLLTPAVREGLAPAERARADELLAAADRPPITAAAVPELLARGLRERDGRMGRIALMLQSLDASTWNGALAIPAAGALGDVATAVSPPAHIAGGFVVSAAVLVTLEREALPTTALAFGAVVVLVLVTFARSRATLAGAAAVLGALLTGVTLLAGAAVLLGQRLNFLNFIAFPITFGIGVEYAINVLQRHRQSPGAIATVVSRTGGAVALCSLTTIIGYGSLLLAQNNALRSFGTLAVIGELACLAVALLALPAALALGSRRRRAQAPR